MKQSKPFLLILLIATMITIYGCGLTSKDTVNESTPISTTKIFALTDKGISISESNGTKWEKAVQKGKNNKIISSVFTDYAISGNAVYIGTDRGVAVSTDNMSTFSNYLEDININHICTDGSNIYLATSKGCYLTTNNITYQKFSNDDEYLKIYSYGPKLYAATKTKIILCTANVFAWSEKYTYETAIQDFSVNQGNYYVLTAKALFINNKKIESIMADNMKAMFIDPIKNNLWISTDKGLNKSSDEGKSWVLFDKTSGLDNLEINSIYANNLNIYLGTPYGLMHSINAGETWKIYRKQNGMVSGKVLKVFVQN